MSDPVSVLSEVMQNSVTLDRYRQLLPALSQCLRDCGCTTVDRIAMWCAQIGHESGGLKWMEELADGSQYEGRQDLGNTQPGDGRKFKGRGPIQVTGRSNYTRLSQWCYEQQLVPTPTFFVDQPDQLASDRYGFLGVTWYWTTQRPLNEAADIGDVVWATKLVNGGTNGLDDRRRRYNSAMGMGTRLLDLTEQKGDTVSEIRLDYDRNIVPQETGWWCGPAATQIVLDGLGIRVPEATLAAEIEELENPGRGDDKDGTDHIGLIQTVLNRRAPAGQFRTFQMPNDPPTRAQKDELWSHLTRSIIDNGVGVVANIVAPANNRPTAVKGSKPPPYPPMTTWHYIALMGLDPSERAVWVADSAAFGGITGWWAPFDGPGSICSLIPPKGVCYSTAPVNPQPPKPEPPKPEPPQQDSRLDVIYHEVTQRLPGRTIDDQELRDFIIDPRRADTVLGHSMNSAGIARVNFEILRRVAEKLGVEIGDIR